MFKFEKKNIFNLTWSEANVDIFLEEHKYIMTEEFLKKCNTSGKNCLQRPLGNIDQTLGADPECVKSKSTFYWAMSPSCF